jgi:serine protease AprX
MRLPRLLTLPLAAAVLTVTSTSATGLALSAPPAWDAKVDSWVIATAGAGPAEFLVYLTEQADVSAAEGLTRREDKGRYVFETLRDTAARTQAPLLAFLAGKGAEHRAYWVANMVWVRGDLALVQELARRDDVAHIYANPRVRFHEPVESEPADFSPQAIEWNVAKVRAPEVWALGFTGQTVVVGGQDTGYDWDHPAIRDKYRGWNGVSADHNYNWHDAIHSGGGSCGPDSPVPCDDTNHGTHTMGTMVGDDGGANQIGVAPGARWMGCRNMDQGNGTPATYTECFQWFIAPTEPGPDEGAARHQQLLGLPAQRGLQPRLAAHGGREHARGGDRGGRLRRQQRFGVQHGARSARDLRRVVQRGLDHQHAYRHHLLVQQPRPGDHRRQ